ncbi:MAG: hypothetical protein Unbinned1322contig1000_53 [Prokaryotic dsDNA virus sp.]|nr:MAG: hypothetical protein Unbinned1322contig1000_53 [Prokaryotic dsDNA virus sp.]|tara:strand:- start:35302 stop:35985 length:684 start_codon:yes stop_codon:yes gene_type:complete
MASTGSGVVGTFDDVRSRDFNLGAFSGDTFADENSQSFEFDKIGRAPSGKGDSGGEGEGGSGDDDESPGASTKQITARINAGIGLAKAGAAAYGAIKEYEHIESASKFNIALANQQFRETRAFGKDKALREETKGFARGEAAVLRSIAQGQSSTGSVATSLQEAEETLAILNATAIETNAMRQAYGFKNKAIMVEYELELAKITRDNRLITAGISALGNIGLGAATF